MNTRHDEKHDVRLHTTRCEAPTAVWIRKHTYKEVSFSVSHEHTTRWATWRVSTHDTMRNAYSRTNSKRHVLHRVVCLRHEATQHYLQMKSNTPCEYEKTFTRENLCVVCLHGWFDCIWRHNAEWVLLAGLFSYTFIRFCWFHMETHHFLICIHTWFDFRWNRTSFLHTHEKTYVCMYVFICIRLIWFHQMILHDDLFLYVSSYVCVFSCVCRKNVRFYLKSDLISDEVAHLIHIHIRFIEFHMETHIPQHTVSISFDFIWKHITEWVLFACLFPYAYSQLICFGFCFSIRIHTAEMCRDVYM